MITACRSCGSSIRWAATKKGKLLPVDAEPNPAGSVELRERPGAIPVAIVHSAGDRPLFGDRYLPHWAACPQADEWRST